jgi:ABC-type nitrate/sulfonate/bicarbonate transport system substrate-binding protein
MRVLAAGIFLLGTLLPLPPAAAAEPVILGSVGSGTANAWPTYIGIAKGFFAAEEITPDLAHAQSNAAVIQQLAAGSINVATNSGLVDPIRAIDKGAPVAIVRIEMQAPPYSLIGKPALKGLAELKGKTISVGGAKDITRIFAERMLASAGLKAGDFDLIYAGATSARYAALKAGAADAAMLAPPFNFRALAEGFANLGNAVTFVDMPFAGMAVNRTWAAANQRTAARLIAVYNKAMAWFYEPKNREEAVAILLRSTKLRQQDADATYAFLHDGRFFEPTGKVSKRKLGTLVEALHSLGDISPSTSVDTVILPGVTQLTD